MINKLVSCCILCLSLLVNLFITPFPVFAKAQSVIITELMVDPEKVPDPKGEWIEVFNNSSVTVSLDEWIINDGVGQNQNHEISGNYNISPNAYAVVCRNQDAEENGGVKCDYTAKMTLSNSNEDNKVILKDSSGNIIDQIAYTKENVKEAKGKSINVSKNAPRIIFIETTYTYGAGDYGTPGKDPYNTKNISSKEFNPALFFSSGAFSLPEGITDEKETTSVSVNEQMIINVELEEGSHSVDLPSGVVIMRSGEGTIDVTKLSIDNIDKNSLSGFTSDTIIEAAMRWGIPDMGLEFNEPVTLNIFVGTSKNGQTLNILRSISTNSDWTSDGIVSPATCAVSSGICTFQATKASYFAAAKIVPTSTPTPTPTPASLASSSTSSSGDSSSAGNEAKATSDVAKAPTCEDTKPGSNPILISALPSVNSVTLNWSKALDPFTHYLLSYGREHGALEFGNPNIGLKDSTSYTVYDLSERTRYYFRIMAVNNCKPGDFSNELSAETLAITKSSQKSDFAPAALGVARSQEIHREVLPKGSVLKKVNIFVFMLNFFGAFFNFFAKLF